MNHLFQIFKVTKEEADKIAASPDDPHFHDFEELLIVMEGGLEHFIDFKATIINAPFVSFITKGKMHRIVPCQNNNNFDAWGIRFKSEFIPETTFQLYAYYHDQANIAVATDRCFNRIANLCALMSAEMQEKEPNLGVVRHLLSALFTMIEAERKKLAAPDDTLHKTQSLTFKNFLQILEENYHRPEGVEFYAEKLFMSSRNLNLICHNIMQQSVSDIIETRKLIEAKNLLMSTDKSVSEIGFELGFKEKAYFTNVFKKKSGQTPTEFREDMKKIIA